MVGYILVEDNLIGHIITWALNSELKFHFINRVPLPFGRIVKIFLVIYEIL